MARPITATLPNGTKVTFDAGTPPEEIERRMALLKQSDPASFQAPAPPPPPKPAEPPRPAAGRGSGYNAANAGPNLKAFKEGSIENAPAIGAGIAGLFTGGLSLPVQAAVVGGTAMGGQGLKDWMQKGVVDPTSAAWEGGKEALWQYGGGKVAKGVASLGPKLKDAGTSLLTRIAKPTNTLLENAGEEWGKFLPDRAKSMAQAFLDRGLRITKPQVVAGQIDAAEDALSRKIAGSTKRAETQPAIDALQDAQQKRKYTSLPEKGQAAFEKAEAEFRRNPLISKDVRSQVTRARPSPTSKYGPPVTNTQIEKTGRDLLPTVTVQKMQKVKQGTYRDLGDAAYGELGSADREAAKQLARGQARAIEAAEPSVKPINEEIGKLIDLRDYAEEAGKRIGNTNPVSLGAQIAVGTKSPGAAAALFERPMFGEPLARGLYGAGGWIPKDVMNPAQFYRLAMLAQMAEDDKQQNPPKHQ